MAVAVPSVNDMCGWGVAVVKVPPRVDKNSRLRRQALGQDLAALVGLAPAGGAAAVEDRDAHQLAHRGHAHDADLAGLPAAPEAVVLVELAGPDVGRGALGGLRLLGAEERLRGQPAAGGAGPGDPAEHRELGRAGDQVAPAEALLGLLQVFQVGHGLLLLC